MSQVLHFLDFASNNKKVLCNWRNNTLLHRYNLDQSLNLQTKSPLFLDSGGYKLLTNNNVHLNDYGLKFDKIHGQETVFDLQRDFGGDLIATLDYPLPPNLVRNEALSRMRASRKNALIAAKRIASSSYNPIFFVAAHGQNGVDIKNYGEKIYQQFKAEGLDEVEFGFAVGSLVPLRGANKIAQIVEQIQGLKQSIPKSKVSATPIHAFGMTGNLIPVLAYLGVDTFDSSAYVREAISLSYMSPQSRKFGAILEIEELVCDCRICKNLNLGDLQRALTSDRKNRPQECGFYKSKYYSDIALHNLEMDFCLTQQVQQAIRQDSLIDFVIEHGQKFNDTRIALEAIAENDQILKKKLGAVPFSTARHKAEKQPEVRTLSLEWTAESFDISKDEYKPSADKTVLFIIPCSNDKPYSSSRSHQIVEQRLEEHLHGQYHHVHKVTLSGLYGPVPKERENDTQVLSYDFRLDPSDTDQIRLVAERLIEYIKKHQTQYKAYCAYATSLAYRTALEQAASTLSEFQLHLKVLPAKPKIRKMTEFYRQSNIEELTAHISNLLVTQQP